jgi:hypothetical protein
MTQKKGHYNMHLLHPYISSFSGTRSPCSQTWSSLGFLFLDGRTLHQDMLTSMQPYFKKKIIHVIIFVGHAMWLLNSPLEIQNKQLHHWLHIDMIC